MASKTKQKNRNHVEISQGIFLTLTGKLKSKLPTPQVMITSVSVYCILQALNRNKRFANRIIRNTAQVIYTNQHTHKRQTVLEGALMPDFTWYSQGQQLLQWAGKSRKKWLSMLEWRQMNEERFWVWRLTDDAERGRDSRKRHVMNFWWMLMK